ncbi:AfsA-related hotdog domain-containing protein [Verminephrobacter aporrectodeae]|uniref:AfsA-related hotdog domain-containing protein n=1 Tax=Verminephrobacter aporrectodeae TaxID=1110389 RepID=UPI0022446384|nr:AfsA-related hotdog domain-containing protein [Verminephrobacter aporrectodeae]MCW8175652.1 hypothetical protein [Verminephrobacter aporrectodeae subsp. tuberculatae]MCW8203237.1 hypothetical protein [Verminephrobacter aporrectodeae subsp. tuberculatae]
MGIYVVVANQFDEFSKHDNVMSYNTLLKELCGLKQIELRGVKFIAGQGLGFEEIQHAYRLAVFHGYAEEFSHWHTWVNMIPAGPTLTHKSKPENILISIPEQSDNGTYTANLLLHAQNELMCDHLTGQHVQGMVLLEACRQMFLAVTERFHLDDYQPPKRYFVLSEMGVRYTAFVFPLPAQIHYRLIDKQQPRHDRVDVHADMSIWQGEQAVTEVNVKFAVMDAKRLGAREASLALHAVSTHVNSLRQRLNTPLIMMNG